MNLKDILGDPISRDEALSRIRTSESAYNDFCKLSEKDQEDVLSFIQGNKGLPILYDDFYKYVFDPERNPERLEDFLSVLFGEPVVIERILQKEGSKLAEEGSLVVMDIIVRLSDGRIVDVKLLYNLTYISLDTFKRMKENISDKMDAWLTFLSSDKPEDIINLVSEYPQFKECYHDISTFRSKPKELITMFSEALIQMDKNTAKYMIEEQQKEIEQQKEEIQARDEEIQENKVALAEKDRIIAELEAKLAAQKN